jgi:hypothetical protein
MPTGIRASRPRRSTARPDTRTGLLLWRFLLPIRRIDPSPEGAPLSLLQAATSEQPFGWIAELFADAGAVQVKLDCRASASAVSRAGIAFIRVSSSIHSRSCSVTASGPNRRPAARRRSASATPPLRGLGSSQNKFVSAAKSAAQTSSGPRQESTPWHLGAGPTRSLREV